MKKTAARTVAGLLSILFIGASCASKSLFVPQRMYPGPPLPYEKTAVLVGGSVKIVSVDGQKVEKNAFFVQVLPGMHTVKCVLKTAHISKPTGFAGTITVDPITISLETKAGHQYSFKGEAYEGEGKWRLDPIKEMPSTGFEKL